jgi:hypothetical protein
VRLTVTILSRTQAKGGPGNGVIWNVIRYETPVIPAKAGIQPVDSAFPEVYGVDSSRRAGRE